MLAPTPFLQACDSESRATGSLPRILFERGERTFGLGECVAFVPGECRIDGVRCDWVRARGEGFDGVVAGGEGFEGVLFDWGFEGGLLDTGEGRALLRLEAWVDGEGVSPDPKTDVELDAGATTEAELVVRTRTGMEGLFLCFEGVGDVKLTTGEVRRWEVSDMTRAREGVDGTAFCLPIVLVEVERGKALGGQILERLVELGTGVAFGDRVEDIETDFEELGLTVVHPLASLVMDKARVNLALVDVVRDSERRERVDVSEGVGMIVRVKVDEQTKQPTTQTPSNTTKRNSVSTALWPSG